MSNHNSAGSERTHISVVASAGGGLTVIARASNPTGQAILKHHFGNDISTAL